MAEAEVEEPEDILKDLSDGDNDSDDKTTTTTEIIAMTMMTRKNK